ncbi:hypothetical protein AVEN_201454-1 [Araneus ventricosus]|uniref:Uncharacterized protein n=1 Tax=Araneus ventricosus TaxID=182803 RepID=A0A4Y2MKS4_ARAVE|nr:hypothetical protein AVEN_201454-1 [Araneus ventricosus]
MIHRHVTDCNLTSEREILMYGTNLLKETVNSDRKHFVPKDKPTALGPEMSQAETHICGARAERVKGASQLHKRIRWKGKKSPKSNGKQSMSSDVVLD